MDKKTVEIILGLRRDIMRLKDAGAAPFEIAAIKAKIVGMGGCPDTTGGPISWCEVDDDIYYDMFG